MVLMDFDSILCLILLKLLHAQKNPFRGKKHAPQHKRKTTPIPKRGVHANVYSTIYGLVSEHLTDGPPSSNDHLPKDNPVLNT